VIVLKDLLELNSPVSIEISRKLANICINGINKVFSLWIWDLAELWHYFE